MAPEQAHGHADRRSDVFALGLLLYEILCLRPACDPHVGSVVERVLAGDVVPVETRNPRRSVPPALAAACRRFLEQPGPVDEGRVPTRLPARAPRRVPGLPLRAVALTASYPPRTRIRGG